MNLDIHCASPVTTPASEFFETESDCSTCLDHDLFQEYFADSLPYSHDHDYEKSIKTNFPDGMAFRVFIVCILLINLCLYFVVRQCVWLYEWMFLWVGKKRWIRQEWLNATNYRSWRTAAIALDTYFQRTEWKRIIPSPHFDYRLILAVVKKLQRHATDIEKLKAICLESACKSNLGGVDHPAVYAHCYSGTKELIEWYVKRTVQAIEVLHWAPMHDKYSFFRKITHLYGRTALCLSGGATFGYYHLGVVKALLDRGLLPNIIAGSSAGSMIAALCCCRTDRELKQLLSSEFHSHLVVFDESWWTILKRLWQTKALFCPKRWQQKLLWVTCGHMTFLESFKKTGRILNVTINSTEHTFPPKLLNHITTPDVLIWSAVLASCAIPGILPPIQLMYKPKGTDLQLPYTGLGEKWLDGSLRTDIPTKALHREFNVNFTIVSQANPHIHLFFFDSKGIVGSSHRGWRGGFILSGFEHYLKLNLMKYLKLLRNLRLSVFGQHDWSSIFLQQFHGNVTIVPQTSILDYFYILSNPSRERLNIYLLRGQRNTWPRIEMIKNRLHIEQAIYKSYNKAKRSIRIDQHLPNVNDMEDPVESPVPPRSDRLEHSFPSEEN